MDYLIKEELRKDRNSMFKNSIMILIMVILMNISITKTNFLPQYRNLMSCLIVVLFVSILIIYLINKGSTIIYNLDEFEISFKKRNFKKEVLVLKVSLKDIKCLNKIENNNPNTKLEKTYYFVYSLYNKKENIYYCEYLRDDKLYRFIFRPSERILRILESKIYD